LAAGRGRATRRQIGLLQAATDVSGMRKKRKARGRAERAALAAVAVEAGVEVELDEPEGAVAPEVGESAEDSGEAAADAEAVTGAETETAAETETETETESDTEVDAVADGSEAEISADAGGESDEDLDDMDAEPEGDSRPQAAQLDEAAFTALIEALLYAADKPLTIARLRQLTRVADTGRIQAALERLATAHAESGIILSHISGGYSFRTNSRFSPWVQQLIQGRPVRLSRAQLETLAIVAYRQPITRPEIDQIRGVDSGATLKLLLDRSLVRILGKREEVGRPLLYGTTREFLDFFSLNDLRELPTLREFSELTEESRGVVEKLGMDAPPAAVAAVVAESQAPAAAAEVAPDVVAAELSDEPAPEPAAAELSDEPAPEPEAAEVSDDGSTDAEALLATDDAEEDAGVEPASASEVEASADETKPEEEGETGS
jgi:segregation and condensation protein B